MDARARRTRNRKRAQRALRIGRSKLANTMPNPTPTATVLTFRQSIDLCYTIGGSPGSRTLSSGLKVPNATVNTCDPRARLTGFSRFCERAQIVYLRRRQRIQGGPPSTRLALQVGFEPTSHRLTAERVAFSTTGEQKLAGPLGLEPRSAESESAALPLCYGPMVGKLRVELRLRASKARMLP